MTAVVRSRSAEKQPRRPRGAGASGVVGAAPNPRAAKLLGLVVALNLFGLLMVLSAAPVIDRQQTGALLFTVQKQMQWALVGGVVFVILSNIDYRRVARLDRVILGISLVMMAALQHGALGVSVNGATRWLRIGPVQIQPSEMAKLGMILCLANMLDRRHKSIDNPIATIRPALVGVAVIGFLLALQPDMGTLAVIFGTTVAMLFMAGANVGALARWSGAGLLAAMVGVYVLGYQRHRIDAFLNPGDDPSGYGYQTSQALYGIARGGYFGLGMGEGRAKWGHLPFAHTDFIFAVVAEELGMVGAVVLIAAFAILGLLALQISAAAPDRLGALIAAGIGSAVVLQAFLNIATVVGLVPVTGLTLPFVSAGGSSLVITMAAMGVLVNIARQGK